jgi:hypothetical protein
MELAVESLLDSAVRNSTIAKRILWDEPNWAPEAAMHIARAWQFLLRFDDEQTASCEESGTSDAASEANPFDRLADKINFSPVLAAWSSLGFAEDEDGVRSLWIADLEVFAQKEVSTTFDSALSARLEGHFALLDATEGELRNAWYDSHGHRRRRLSMRQALAYCFLPIVLIASCWYFLRSEPSWVDFYFQNTKLIEPASKGDLLREIRVDWSHKPPLDGMELNNYSARFYSCLQVDRRSKVGFRLGSDDGSRLFIDDVSLIDIWSPHAFMSRTKGRMLDPGIYRLKLEYFQEYGGASLRLDIRAEGQPIARSSSVRLIPPKTVSVDSVVCP